jgi:hypothetical protein
MTTEALERLLDEIRTEQILRYLIVLDARREAGKCFARCSASGHTLPGQDGNLGDTGTGRLRPIVQSRGRCPSLSLLMFAMSLGPIHRGVGEANEFVRC